MGQETRWTSTACSRLAWLPPVCHRCLAKARDPQAGRHGLRTFFRVELSLFRGRFATGGERFLLIELGRTLRQLALAFLVQPFKFRVVAFLHVGIFAEYACHGVDSFGSV